MLNRTSWFLGIPIACFCFLPFQALSQEPLIVGQEITDSIPLYGTALLYSLQLTKGTLVEVILDLDEEDAPVSLVLGDKNGQVIAEGYWMNYPQFWGLYLLFSVPATGTYKLQIKSDPSFNHRSDFRLIANVHNGDEAENRTIHIYDILDGVIGPDREADSFTITLRKDTPVLLVVTAPNSILDSVVGILNAQGEVVAYNDDFFGTSSTLFYVPESNGVYYIIIQGKYVDSIGPYSLTVNPAPAYNAPFTTDDEIDLPGNMYVYQVALEKGRVYDFAAIGVDEFYPILALADAEQNVLAYGQADVNYPAATILGYVPLQDETRYLYAMGDTADATGFVSVSASLREDEADGIQLLPGYVFQGVIGPVGDVDNYRFSAEEGMDYSILITPTQLFLDPVVKVFDSNGNELFFNDNSADGYFSMLSGIVLPASAEYRIQVGASPSQSNAQRLTGSYVIQLATGTTFDWGAPRIAADLISITPTASGVHISIPTAAIADDTYPLSATFTLDQAGGDVFCTIEKGKPLELDVAASPDEIFFLTLSDASRKHNAVGPVTIPAPRILAELDGMPTALAVDRSNNLYVTDSYIGGIVKYAINGASEVILKGQETKGGIQGPVALAFDADGNLFYVNSVTHSIAKVLPGGATETFAEKLNYPVALTIDKEGVMYVAQIGSDTIDKIYPDGRVEPFVTGVRNPYGLAFSPDGVLYVCNSTNQNSAIYRIAADGTPAVFVELFADSLRGMAFDRDGNLYVTDENSGYLYRIDPEGRSIIFTRNVGSTAGLAFGYGDYAKTLFVSSCYSFSDPYRDPFYYELYLLAVPTGRTGIPVPDAGTDVRDWMML